MESQTTTTSNFRSLPANYVTLAQLRERWLKERGGREDLKQLNDDQTERDCVGIGGEEETKTKNTASEEVQSPLTEVEAGAGERCSRGSSANRGTGKWGDQRRTRERREVGSESRAEMSDGLEEKSEVGPKSRVPPVEESTGFNLSSRHWSAKREMGKRNGGARHGNSRDTGSEDRSENNCADERDEIEAVSKPLKLNDDSEIGTGSVSNVPEHKADSEPKDGVLAVNGWVRKGITGLRQIGDKAAAEKKGKWARRNQRNWEVGSGSKSESNGFDLEADIEPKVMVMSIHGGFCGNDDLGMSPEIGIEKMVERHGKDQSDVIRPELKALSVNGGLKKNGKKEDLRERKNRKGRKFGGGSSNDLDQAAGCEPKLMVTSVHGRFWRNGEKDTSPETGIENTEERRGKDQSDEIRPELKALSVNEGRKKNGEKEDLQERKNRKGGKFGGGSSNNLDREADIEPKVTVMSIHGGFWRNGEKDTSPETGIEKTVERHGKDHSDVIRPELKALSVNEGRKKNGEKEDAWERKNRKGGKFIGGSSNGLDQASGREPKLMVMSVHYGFWRNDEKDTSLERNIEEQRAEAEPKSVNKGSKKMSKKKKGPRRRDSENNQTIVQGRAEANTSLEVGVEAMVEEKRDDQSVGTETESRTLSVNEGIREKNGKKNQGGGGGRNMKIWQTRGETRPDSEPKVGALSANDSVGKANRRSNRNGEKEVTQEDGNKTEIARNGSKKRNKESKNPDDCNQLTVTREDNGGGSIRNSEKVESQGSGIDADVKPGYKTLSGIGGTRNENGGFRMKTSGSDYVGYRESRSNVPGRFGSHKKVFGKEGGVKVWVKKEELSGGKK